ncbi:MAG: Acyl-CoA dehydrogenase, short-chain specific, partial [uncultured Nocardioides sp.]
ECQPRPAHRRSHRPAQARARRRDHRAGAPVERGRGERDVPPRRVRHARRARCPRAAVRRGARWRRPALRGLPPGPGGAGLGVGQRRGGHERARPLLLRAGLLRHRRAEGALAPRHARRRPAGRVLPLRGARRLRPGGHAHDGAARRRRLRAQRRQGVDHPRGPGRLLQGDGAHQRRARRPPRDLLLPGARRHRGPERGQPGAEDGPDRLDHRHDALRRRPGAGRPSPRRGGRRAQDRARGAGRRPPGHRRGGGGAGPGRPRPGRRVRPRAAHLRAADHRPPGPGLRARRHGGRGADRPGDDPARRPPQGPRAAVLPGGEHRQAGRDRQRHEGHHGRRAGARRLRLHPRLPRRALHARGQGHADLRGDQPDPAHGHRPLARQGRRRQPAPRL